MGAESTEMMQNFSSKLFNRFGSFSLFEKILKKFRNYFEERYIENDILFILTYMASLSTANLSRDKIFEMASEKSEYSPSKYFRIVRDLTQKWHYDYATACELVSEKIRNERLRKLFKRFSNSIAAGEPDEEFLEREWRTYKVVRKDEYERSLDSLRKWTDAYTSILVSTSLISVVILLAVVIYSSGNAEETLIVSSVISLFTGLFGVFMLYKAAPKDKKFHEFHIKSPEQRTLSKLAPILSISSMGTLFISVLLPTLLNLDIKIWNLDARGFGFLISGFFLLPAGLIARKDYQKVSLRDEVFTNFVEALGSIKSGSGASMAHAIEKIDRKNLGELENLVEELYRRLSLNLDSKMCWEKFVGESGSYLIEKFTAIFLDAVNLGGDPALVGKIVGSSNLEMVLLRLKRELISSGFINLVIPLHATMTALMMFISQILATFSDYIGRLSSQFAGVDTGRALSDVSQIIGGFEFGFFSGIPITLVTNYGVIIVVILTLVNTLATNVVKGGGKYMYLFYGSVFLIISGIIVLAVPPVVKFAFSLPSFIEGW